MTNNVNEYAEILSNISDMNIEESTQFLLAAQSKFLLEDGSPASFLDIVNILNETDNNNSITVKQLSESLTKLINEDSNQQLSLEKLVRHTSTIGQVTRESGLIIGNSLRTIYSRINTIDDSINALEEIGVDTGSNAETVLDSLASKWKSLSEKKQQDIGLVIAGRYQLSRLMILLNQMNTENA